MTASSLSCGSPAKPDNTFARVVKTQLCVTLALISADAVCVHWDLVPWFIVVAVNILAWFIGEALCACVTLEDENAPSRHKMIVLLAAALFPAMVGAVFWLPATRVSVRAYEFGYTPPLCYTAETLARALQTPQWARLRAIRSLSIAPPSYYGSRVRITLQSGASWSFHENVLYPRFYIHRSSGGRIAFYLSPHDQRAYADTPATRQRILMAMAAILHRYQRHESRMVALRIQRVDRHSLAQKHQASWS